MGERGRQVVVGGAGDGAEAQTFVSSEAPSWFPSPPLPSLPMSLPPIRFPLPPN